MGYTIATRARNKKLQVKMAEFMEKNYRDPDKLFKQGGNYSRFASNHYTENSTLSYDSHKMALGFDYNACEPERDYIFAVVRWMTLKVGQLREFKGLGKVPCYVYDGGTLATEDVWPVLIDTVKWKLPKNSGLESNIVSNTGFKTQLSKLLTRPGYEKAKNKKAWLKDMKKNMESLYGAKIEKVDEIIFEELNRLDSLWFCMTNKTRATHILKQSFTIAPGESYPKGTLVVLPKIHRKHSNFCCNATFLNQDGTTKANENNALALFSLDHFIPRKDWFEPVC